MSIHVPPIGMIADARARFHQNLLAGPLVLNGGVPSIADNKNKKSIRLALGMMGLMGSVREVPAKQPGQTSGGEFEQLVAEFIKETFLKLNHLRPGQWRVANNPGYIGQFEQYQHLVTLLKLVREHPDTRASLGGDYLIKPDLVICREPEDDEMLNAAGVALVGGNVPPYSPLRKANNMFPLLHASISCKWTIRSDRSQNTRTEALNLMRNRKGAAPRMVAVTAEPLPSRIGSIAYGTGDLDCIYHIALPELVKACQEIDDDDDLRILIEGRRLRDISDMPLDLIS